MGGETARLEVTLNDTEVHLEPRSPEEGKMPSRAVVAIGASAGGVEALSEVVRGLPADLPAAVLVVLHVPPGADSHLPSILERAGRLPAHHARDGEPLMDGTVFIAPPDDHLTIHDGHVRLDRGPRQNHHRPAIDPLFRSVSRWRDGRSVAVVLSGVRSDGVSGAIAVAANGGAVLVEDPEDATYPGMPEAVLTAVERSMCVPIEAMADRITELVSEKVRVGAAGAAVGGPDAAAPPRSSGWRPESERPEDAAMTESSDIPSGDEIGIPPGPVRYGCPECGGVLVEIPEGGHLRFRCRVGHEFSADDLLDAQNITLENALWSALRGLEERAELGRRMADRLEGVAPAAAGRHRQRAHDATIEADLIREFLLRLPPERSDEPA
jgi:two-component system, chemotaxis family, protein-glutamate methylesterase/glutaminase